MNNKLYTKEQIKYIEGIKQIISEYSNELLLEPYSPLYWDKYKSGLLSKIYESETLPIGLTESFWVNFSASKMDIGNGKVNGCVLTKFLGNNHIHSANFCVRTNEV